MGSPNLHVLHVITGIDRGGAENHLFDLVRHQRASGMAVTVAYLRGNGYWAAPLRALGLEVHALGLRFYGDPRPLLRLRRVINGEELDLVHAHLPPAELYCRFALLGISAKRLPMIVTKHIDEPFCKLPGNLQLGRWVARRAARVIAISNAVRTYLTDFYLRLPPEQVVTIYYSLDAAPYLAAQPEAVARLRKEWGISEETIVVGTAARLVPQKSLDTLIEGFAMFASGCAAPAKLVIAGCGPLEADLREHARKHGIADRVVWAGFREDIPVVMSAFDIFALTSLYEGFGLVVLEAMAAGRPVIASRSSALPEVVADGETAILIPTLQPEAVAGALQQLAEPERRRALGESGRRRAVGEFTPAVMFEKTDKLYADRFAQTGCTIAIPDQPMSRVVTN
jgi:glycosyltransferase involved in cell wall biosynthesis